MPALNTSQARIRVIVTDLAANDLSDASDADFTISTATAVVGGPESGPALPTAFSLGPAIPNPVRASAAIRFALPEPRAVTLEMFDVTGRRVATVLRSSFPAGRHQAVWDGRDANGRPVGTGLYFDRIIAGDFRATSRLVMLR